MVLPLGPNQDWAARNGISQNGGKKCIVELETVITLLHARFNVSVSFT